MMASDLRGSEFPPTLRPMPSHVVRFGNVSIKVAPWRHPSGRDYWRARYRDAHGRPQVITRADLGDAKEAALKAARTISKGAVDISKLEPAQLAAIRRMLDADPSLGLVDEFLAWRAKARPQKLVDAAIEEFLTVKEANRGRSIQNLRTLRRDLLPLRKLHGTRVLADITVAEVEGLIGKASHSARTRRNRRASLVTFFRWCREREYLPEGRTVAEKAETPIVADTIPETYTPDELQKMLAAVKLEYLPWLALSAFAGIRREEIYPLAGGTKSPLDWSDFKWSRGIIEIRPETAKTRRRRIVPILPVLRAWLEPVKGVAGPVGATAPPHKLGRGKDAEPETKRLGALVGGWRRNALRHSFISYRAPVVGLGQTALEAGNSESEARRSYNDAKGKDEAEAWFSVFPAEQPGTRNLSH